MIASDEAIGTCLKTIEQFVNTFYWGALGRFASDAERQSESTQLRTAQAQGQSQLVAEAQRFGRALFHSAEYAARNRTDAQFVHDLYYAWEQRPADESGYQGWLTTISAQGRKYVLNAFGEGGEFAGRVSALCVGMETEAVQWQMTDHAGTVRLVVNASGAVIDGHDTTPFGDEIIWGAVRSANAPQQQQGAQQSAEAGAGTTGLYGWNETMRARYASLERDTPTGLEHTDWRKYDNWQGRWTTTDPSHQSMSVGNPQSFNRYSYVQNDPVNFVDPSGLLLAPPSVGATINVSDYYDSSLSLFGGSVFYRDFGSSFDAPDPSTGTYDPNDPNDADPPQTEPERHMQDDCHAFASIVDELARKSWTDSTFVAALDRRLEAPAKDAHEGGPRYREFTSTGFKDQFTDNVGLGNSPNQVHHYVGTFSRAYGAGVVGLASSVFPTGANFADTLGIALKFANEHEAGGTPSNAADMRVNAYSVPAGVMLGYGIVGRRDIGNMIRKDICR